MLIGPFPSQMLMFQPINERPVYCELSADMNIYVVRSVKSDKNMCSLNNLLYNLHMYVLRI